MIMEDHEQPLFPSSKGADEWPARAATPVQRYTPQPKENPLDKLKSNPIVLGILIGVVIGIILTNMRPVIINPTK